MNSARSKAACFLAALAAVVCVGAPARAQPVPPPDPSTSIGRAVPDARLVADNGDTLALHELAGGPLILSPVFTTCPHACPAITASLIDALDGLGGCGETFNVLTLSFDPQDSPEALREYRRITGIPDEWVLATGAPDQVGPVLEAVDFRFEALPTGGFAHPNAIAFLTPTLAVSGYLNGLMYTQAQVKAGLRLAAGRTSLLERARPYLIPVAAAFLVATLLVIALTKRKNAGAGPTSSQDVS